MSISLTYGQAPHHAAAASAASRTPTKGSERRVLGELSTNTRNAPPSAVVCADGRVTTTPKGSPLKVPGTVSPAALGAPKDQWGFSPFLNARKRPWEAMDSANDSENCRTAGPQRSPLRHEAYLSPPSPEEDMHRGTPTAGEFSQTYATDKEKLSQSPVCSSQSNAVSMLPTSASFSSLIDYDPAGASDKSKSASVSPAGSGRSSVYTKPPTRAETLRLRLQMAMYKVNTDQIYIPMSDLTLPQTTLRRKLPASPQLQVTPQPTSSQEGDASSTRTSPHSPVFITMDNSKTSVPKLLPAAPILQPTVSSRRIIYETNMPSSPPSSSSNSEDESHLESHPAPSPPRARFYATPAVKRVQMMASYDCLSPSKENYEEREELTSSVVKGKAASSLLELSRRM